MRYRHINRNPYKIDKTFVVAWVLIMLVNLAVLGVGIWAVIKLVTWLTSGGV